MGWATSPRRSKPTLALRSPEGTAARLRAVGIERRTGRGQAASASEAGPGLRALVGKGLGADAGQALSTSILRLTGRPQAFRAGL